MKKFFFLFYVLFPIIAIAQDEIESSKPSFDTEIERRCAILKIEDDIHYDVTITLKSQSPDYFVSDKFRVKVIVKSSDGENVYKKTFKNAYLYIYSDGSIQVGKPKFNQIIISRKDDIWFGVINEKEGIW